MSSTSDRVPASRETARHRAVTSGTAQVWTRDSVAAALNEPAGDPPLYRLVARALHLNPATTQDGAA